MWRIIRLLFTGHWNVPKAQPKHEHKFEQVETLMNKKTTYSGQTFTSKVYVSRCTDCGLMYHYEVK